jgi:autotransporter-associated beta strand protein
VLLPHPCHSVAPVFAGWSSAVASRMLWLMCFSQRAAIILAVGLTALQAYGATIVKTNNTVNLSQATSWTNNVAPGNADIAQWDSTVTAANTVSLGADVEWLGLKILNPGGPVTLNAGNTLTLDGSGADLSAAAQDLALNCNLALGASQIWPVVSGRNLTVGAALSGTALLTLPGPGTVSLSGTAYSLGTSAAGNNALALNGGTLVMNSGTLTLAGNASNNDGSHIQGGAAFKQTGGTVNSSYYTRLGSSGTGTLTISGGRFNNTGEILFAFPSTGMGTLNVTNAGTVSAHFLRLGNNGPGVINLDGGLIMANRIYCNSGQGYFYFNGGTLQVNASPSSPWFDSSVPSVFIKNGGAILDTAGKNVTCAANLQAYSGSTNGLIKTGLGTLTLTGTNSYAGPTLLSAGTLLVNGKHNGTGPFTVNAGTTLGGAGQVASAVSVLDGGMIASGPGPLTVGSLMLGTNATAVIGFGAPGAPTNGLIQVNGSLTLGGQLLVDDLGSMASNATYTAFYYTGTLSNNGVTISAASDWEVTLDTSTPHYVRVTTVRKYGFIEIAGGDQTASSLYTNLTAYVHGPYSGQAYWYEVRSNALTGALMDFGAHAPANPWTFTARHLRGGTNYIVMYALDGAGSVQSNYVRYTLTLGPNTPVRPRPIPAEVWWGGLSTNSQMTNFSQWPFVQRYEDGYFFHSAGWNVTSQGWLMQQLSSNLRQFNTKYWPELGGNCPSPSTTWYQGQTNSWGGWAMGCQNNGIIWSEFTHDYHMENMEPVCQVNPTWSTNDQTAWWTGDLTKASGTYPYTTGIWRDTFNGYYLMFPHIKVGHTSQPEYWPWDAYPAEVVNQLSFTVTNASGGNVPFSFNAHDIVGSFVNMASAIGRPYFSLQSDAPWNYFGTWPDQAAAATMRAKIRVYEQYLQSRASRHTLICNVGNAASQGGGDDAQDLYYMQSSLNNLYTHQREGGRANRYLFESWYWGIPHAVVPETKSGSYCNLVLTGIKYLKGIADTNGTFEQLDLIPLSTNGTVLQLQLKNNGDVQCLPALAGMSGSVAGVSTRYFTTNGSERTTTFLTPEGWCYTNMLQPGGFTNLFALTLAAGLSSVTNDNALLEAFWNPQDPLGIVRDRVKFNTLLSPPGTWADAEIGTLGVAGGSAISGSNYSILGSGADIYGTADACHFLYQTTNGDGTFTARVTSQTAADVWSKAGVMVRESTAAGARNLFVCITPNNGVSYQNRPTTSGSSYTTTASGPTAPYWVRLVRSNTTFTAFSSSNGATWTQIGGGTNLSGFTSTALWGLAVTAHNNALASAANFDSVTFEPPYTNHVPVLATNANRTLVAGATLVVTNTATDLDSPPQVLTFSLVSAPTNATINPTNGVLVWRPLLAQAPVVTSIRVAVADSGSPPLSATQSFWVTVNLPALPTLSAPSMNNGAFQLSVSGDAGPDYALWASTNLVNWNPVLTNYSATPPVWFTDPAATNYSQRFYRIILGP